MVNKRLIKKDGLGLKEEAEKIVAENRTEDRKSIQYSGTSVTEEKEEVEKKEGKTGNQKNEQHFIIVNNIESTV